MPRRPRIHKRVILPDPLYTHEGVAKFMNVIMQRGKKSTAESIVYGAFDRIAKATKKDPVEVFESAIKNVTPVLEVKPRRIGGATYQVPVEIKPERRLALARRWIVRFARTRSGKSMQDKLAGELMDAANGVGGAIKRREETHKMAESNKAFSHFRY
ncbi:MAG TPA: 30S ribosomal protein S7 [Candidatus Eisenbacteria bacterium]|nr:30S ribosomal protein S7 [Candidatus Eisenbacteria bacterium]